MKIIHTADWHLGQTFFEYDRKGEHTLFLTWLREQVKVHEVDGLLLPEICLISQTYRLKGVQVMYRELFDILPMPDKSKPFIVMWYLQATCSKILEKNRAERTIIGRLECFSSEVFDEKIAYTALGHLHRTQRVLRHENARYAGAPLPMLFVEKNNKEGVTEENIID